MPIWHVHNQISEKWGGKSGILQLKQLISDLWSSKGVSFTESQGYSYFLNMFIVISYPKWRENALAVGKMQ